MLAIDPRTAARKRHYPSISLLVPVEGAATWQQRLRRLERDAVRRLVAELGPDLDPGLLERLHTTVEGAKAPPGARSVAVFVNADDAACIGVAVAVRERVVIDDTFATRDIVHHELRSPRYWLLTVTLDAPRLHRGHGTILRSHPLHLEPLPPSRTGSRDRRGRDRTDIHEARRARRLRDLDHQLATALRADDDPVIVVGAEPTISRFLAQTRNANRIEAVVRRAPGPDAALPALIEPPLTDVLATRRATALAALERAMDAGTAISGIEPVWARCRDDKGMLLVEEGYEHPATIAADGALLPADDATAPGVLDDAVDDIIELVLASNGRTELLPDGALSDHGRIVLVPRLVRR